MMFAYSLLLGAGLAMSSPWWVYRMLTTRRYREGLRERLGRIPVRLSASIRGKQVIWVHAVSVGEVLAASRLLEELERTLRPGHSADAWQIVISTTTRTGQALARERFGPDRVFWFPLDFAFAVRSWLRVLQPRLLVLVESELWPRLLAECSRRGVPVAVANARMSDRSFRRARRVKGLWARVFRGVSVFLAQSEETAQRYRVLRVPAEKIQVTGNLKYDIQPRPTEMADVLRPVVGRRPVVVAGSLLHHEESLLLQHWPDVYRAAPGVVLLLAPRHPERFDEVARLISERFPLIRASDLLNGKARQERPGQLQPLAVLLLDTVGDLASVYGLADVAFLGGSLVRKGGHNPLEAARFGVPVLMGPNFENFREIVTEMLAAGGVEIVHDGAALSRTLSRLLKDRVEADALGRRGQLVFERRSGATERTISALLALLAGTRPAVTEVTS